MKKITPKYLFTSLAIGCLLSTILTSTGFADLKTPQPAPSFSSVGAFLGLGFVGNNGGTKLNIGLDAAHRFDADFGFGAYLSYISLGSVTDPATQISTSQNLVVLAAEGNYYFHDKFDGLHVGVKIGPQFTSFSSSLPGNPSNNQTSLAFGGHAGYDYNISHDLTFGPEISILTSTQTNAPTITSVIGILKYFF